MTSKKKPRILLFIIIFTIISCCNVYSQSVSGKWYGVGNPDIANTSNSYLCEFIITQNGNKVTGHFNYFFRNGYFSNKITGTYNAQKRLFIVKPLPILFHQSVDVGTGVDCIMTGYFMLKVSKQEVTLTGTFESDEAHKYTSAPLKVKFYKMQKDEPELKERIKNKELILEQDEPAPAPVVQQTASNNVLPAISQITETEKLVKQRATVYSGKTFDFNTDSVTVELYDNGELDYDSISVFYNNKLVVYKQQLDTKKPISFKVKISANEADNALLMFAENLGTIPPNSAIMIITDDTHRYEVPLNASYQKNAAVRLRKITAE